MRALVVVGMMLVTGQAAATNFGVTVEKFVAGVVGHRELGLRDRGCRPEFCYVSDGSEKRWLYIQRDRNNVVTQILFELPASAWSESAALLDVVQSGLLIPPLNRIADAEVTMTAKTLPRAGISIRGRAIVCSALVRKNRPENVLGACKPG